MKIRSLALIAVAGWLYLELPVLPGDVEVVYAGFDEKTGMETFRLKNNSWKLLRYKGYGVVTYGSPMYGTELRVGTEWKSDLILWCGNGLSTLALFPGSSSGHIWEGGPNEDRRIILNIQSGWVFDRSKRLVSPTIAEMTSNIPLAGDG